MTIQYLERGTSTFHLTPSDLLTDVLFSLFPFYVFYMPRYMRLKIVSAEKEVEPIMSGREAAYHEAFGMVSSHGPVFVLTALLGTVAIPLSGFEPRLSALNLFDVVSVYLSSLGFATYLWVYASSSWGLHKLGSAPIELRPFFEDRMMGVKAIGTLALSLTVAYFGGLLFLTLLFFPFFATNPFYTALILGFLLIGVGMFFLPLISVNGRCTPRSSCRSGWLGFATVPLLGSPALARKTLVTCLVVLRVGSRSSLVCRSLR